MIDAAMSRFLIRVMQHRLHRLIGRRGHRHP